MRPTAELLRLFIAWLALALAACVWESFVILWQIGGGLLFLLLAVDALTLPRRGRITGQRSLPGRFALGVSSQVTLTVTHTVRRTLKLEVFDGIPTAAEAEGLPHQVSIPPGEYAAISYDVSFVRRGQHVFTAAHVLVGSALGLWRRLHFIAGESQTKAYPNYEPVVRFALLAMANRVEQMGIVRRRRMGASLDFHQLRDYQDGDILSRIDWKATSRRSTLVSRDYEETRNQTILLVPDCGRRMRALDGGLSQFDHCLNAMLLIAFIALRQGDEVGVAGFGGVQRWLPPVKGAHSMPKLLNHLYNYEASSEPSDFIEAAERVMTLQKRRALVIMLTNLRSEDGATLAAAASAMQRRHLVLAATLREQELDQKAAAPIDNLHDALQYGALSHYFGERRQLLESLRARKILTVDESAQMLPVALANKYLDVKAGGLL
ncbi:DUF58 domain-containing protein [Prosthecobacter vanneervenii]|uniref:Uncharacterized protein (DUF58 family) n=1 Tax=Prosthecobacter vanneervenii TaxID=48466 RepID=A0A7W8DKR3_9BACT|nr:DUF58 domain-containing protein [Prosthecobacter vanneervenii]MBB5033529.1 uncharacterized protein (DUF58 family) [Prosthecobacter vanneervenii]